MTFPAPPVVQLVPKHGLKDCLLAAMAAYLGRPYEEVVAASEHVRKAAWRTGVTPSDALRIARKLKCPCRWTRTFVLDEDTGVLGIVYNDASTEHVVLLLEGRIVELEDKPLTSWDPSAYLTANNARATTLLVRR